MMKRVKGQSSSPAAALVGIITLLFVFYILFIPAEERLELLEGRNASTIGEESGLLLDESPGRLSFTEKALVDHNIPNVYLSEVSNAVVLAQENPFMIRKGWFGEQRKLMVFAVDDISRTQNIVLSFQAPERSGVLSITLNGRLIFEGRVEMQNPPPVVLPRDLLAGANQLEFSVAGSFLSKRRFSLTDVKVVGEVIDVEKQMAASSFTISQTEIDNLETAFLDFFPICQQRSVGVMTIEMNGKIVYSAVPSCESLNRQDLDENDFKESKNTILFKIDKGSYRVEQVRVRTILKPVRSFVDYFDVKARLYNDVKDRDRQVILRVEFVDDRERKRAELNVNGRLNVIDQLDDVYEADISPIIREGNNYVEIRPLTELDVARLLVRAD